MNTLDVSGPAILDVKLGTLDGWKHGASCGRRHLQNLAALDVLRLPQQAELDIAHEEVLSPPVGPHLSGDRQALVIEAVSLRLLPLKHAKECIDR